tara:strand:+ start:1625 stop:2011 length:387 start_codon:yes stop_codon:yes gene_type:complete
MTQTSLKKEWQEHFNKGVNNALKVLNAYPELKQFVKDFNGKDGFMFTQDERIRTIVNALESDGHSGYSFACTMRECQRRFLNLQSKEEEINNCQKSILQPIGPPVNSEIDFTVKRCVTPDMEMRTICS